MERAAMRIRLKYLVEDRDRHGNPRIYVRVPGQPKVRLRETPGTPEFLAAYEAALATKPKSRAVRGSFREACEGYYASKAFSRLDTSTRSWRRKALDRICVDHGTKPVALMMPKHVRELREELADSPAVANNRLKAIKALFKWALEAEIVDRNPSRDVQPLSYHTDGHHTWTVEEVAQFETRWPLGTKPRLAMALMLYTGGRREDAVRLGRQHVAKGRVQFAQAKNEHRRPVRIDVPLHPDLKAAIDAMPPNGHMTFLVTEWGKPFTPNGFGNWFAARCREAGVPGRAHGLRKALAARLAEKGATAKEIQAWTGHTGLDEIEVYTRGAARRTLADNALAKMLGNG